MALKQSPLIVPPLETDTKLVDFAGIIQKCFVTLFSAAHKHVGHNGVLTAAPTSSQGLPGDIVVAVVSGSAYIYFKTSATQWYRLGPGTAV